MKAAEPAAAAPEPRRIAAWTVYTVALVLLGVAVVLAAFRVGERAGRLSDWQALVLGVTQGLTELLPVSSSGHLILVPWIADWHYLEAHPDFNKTFDVALHLGTLVAVVAYFWRTSSGTSSHGCLVAQARRGDADERLAWGCSSPRSPRRSPARWARRRSRAPRPAVADRDPPGGLRRPALGRRPDAPAARARRSRRRDGVLDRRLADPGADAGHLPLGHHDHDRPLQRLDRDAAARFSFLLLVPVVLGAVIYKGIKHVLLQSLPAGSAGPFIVGTLAAAAVGLIAIDLLLGYLRRHDYSLFVIYRLVLAAAILIVIVSGARSATF